MITCAGLTVPLECPRCRGSLAPEPAEFHCLACSARYPVVAGIPDLRVFPDPWIGLEEDRQKARRLAEVTEGMSFAEAVQAYWQMTPGTPPHLARRFIEHALGAEQRSAQWLAQLDRDGGPVAPGPWLDLGCGTGDLAACVRRSQRPVIGIDIALRWLVIARKRPGVDGRVPLVCCCAERLPFPKATFARVVGLGLLEHCQDAREVLAEARRVLEPGGDLRLRTLNRFSILREPHVGVWGVGFVPRRWADRWVRWWSGQRYLNHRPLSPRELRISLDQAGFPRAAVEPAQVLDAETERLRATLRPMVRGYRGLRRAPLAGRALTWVAPQLEVRGTLS